MQVADVFINEAPVSDCNNDDGREYGPAGVVHLQRLDSTMYDLDRKPQLVHRIWIDLATGSKRTRA